MLKPRIHSFSPGYPDYQEHIIPKDFVQTVERSQYFSLIEKLELLALFFNRKITTEIYMEIPFTLAGDLEKAEEHFLKNVENEVKKLGLAYFIDTHTKLNRKSGKQREFVWFQVSRNQTASDYLQKNGNKLSDPDYGVLYGFPTTAVQAFLGFIPTSQKAPKTIGCYYFGGIFSEDFIQEEQQYFDDLWEEISRISPVLKYEAEKHYKEVLA